MACDLVALAIGGKGAVTRAAGGGPLDEVEIDGYPVSCVFVLSPTPSSSRTAVTATTFSWMWGLSRAITVTNH